MFKNLKGYRYYNPLKIRMQIYDGERGVVKCFGVYFTFCRKDAKSQSLYFRNLKTQTF